jgi:hypothetical protein
MGNGEQIREEKWMITFQRALKRVARKKHTRFFSRVL